jgi:uncharacterized protein YegL
MNDVAGNTTKITAAKNAATKFVSILSQGRASAYEIAVIGFSSNVTLICNLTSNEATLLSAIQSLRAWGSTAMGDAIVSAVDLMLGRGGKSSVVLMTDGKSNAGTILPSIAGDYASRQNVLINTIGFGKDADNTTLENIANATNGMYYFAASSKELVRTYQTIAESFVSPVMHYGSRILMLLAIPLILFLPEIERGAGTVYKTIVYTVLKKPEKLPVQIGVKCPACGRTNSPSARFCGACRTSLVEPTTICHRCHTPNRAGARFCSKCGVRLEE